MAINTENFDEVLFVNASIGSDDYNGTIDTPYKTIATAVSNATGNNVLINIGKGIYEVNSIIDMSKTNKILTFVGKSKDTTLIIKNVYTAGSFHGDLNIYNLIFKPADNFSGDTRVLSYSIDSREVNYYNCVFTRSSNGQFPTNGLMYTSGSGSANMNKNLYNCSIKGITPICGSGGLKVVNCCTDSSTLEGHLTIVDCLAGVTYDNKYKTRNNNYGVYSGENRWSFIKALISDNGILKTFDPLTNSIINFDGDISEMNNNNSTCTFIDNINDILPLINLKQPGVKLIFNKNTKSSVASLKTTKQLFLANGDFSTRVANNIDYFKFNYNIPDGTTIKTVVSINSGAAWYSHIDGAWTQLDNIIPIKNYSELSSEEKTQWNTFLDEVLTKGINIQDINTLDFNTLNSEKIRFAYAIQISDANANAEAILKDLKWQFDSIGSYEQLNPKTDVNIKITNNDISITPLKNIELMKINVGISSQVPQVFDTSGLLDKETFKGKDEDSVKKADSIYVPDDVVLNSDYGIDINGNLGYHPRIPIPNEITSYIFPMLTKDIQQSLSIESEGINYMVQCYAKQPDLTNVEEVFESYANPIVTNHSDNVETVEDNGTKITQIKNNNIYKSTNNSETGFHELTIDFSKYIYINSIEEVDNDE